MRFVLSILGVAVVAASVTFAVAARADKKSELEEAKAQAKAQAEQAALAKAGGGNAEAAMAGACMQWEVQKLATSKGADVPSMHCHDSRRARVVPMSFVLRRVRTS